MSIFHTIKVSVIAPFKIGKLVAMLGLALWAMISLFIFLLWDISFLTLLFTGFVTVYLDLVITTFFGILTIGKERTLAIMKL